MATDLKAPCQHGNYDAHSVMKSHDVGGYSLLPCPGGTLLPPDSLFEGLQDVLEDIYCVKLQKLGVHERGRCQSFAADAVGLFRERLDALVGTP